MPLRCDRQRNAPWIVCSRVGAEQIKVGVAAESPLQSTANTQARSPRAKNTPRAAFARIGEVGQTLWWRQTLFPCGGASGDDSLLIRTASLAAGRRQRRGGKPGKTGRATQPKGAAVGSSGTSPSAAPSGRWVSRLSLLGHTNPGGGQAMGPCPSGTSPSSVLLPLREAPVTVCNLVACLIKTETEKSIFMSLSVSPAGNKNIF